MKQCIGKMRMCLDKVAWVGPLLARITIGAVFIESGWGKLHNLDKITEYFTSLGIPFANIQAPMVSAFEFVFGLTVFFGFLTRLTSIPLIGIMAVAIITAKRSELEGWSDIFGLIEFLYIVLLVWLITAGPGKASIDAIWCKKKK